ncbi:MAG TPA: SIS domain-containing protein [Bryobacteraceae bacterium]|jgi:D-sedoheptulose 7-phosphate isomerase|nr:SIS domain-containing protein [Bryobacteraceae bacterium]
MSLRDYLVRSAEALVNSADAIGQPAIEAAIDCIVGALAAGRPLLVCGNGGSAADAMHIAGELVARFLRDRRALPVICLSESPVVLTAWSNDSSFETVFARQVEAYGGEGAVLMGLSTSGTSRNVVAAFEQARRMGMKTIALTGEGGGKLAPLCDFLLAAPSRYTPIVQQVHLCLYHYICEHVERRLA